jgi:hypothetical protein
MNWGIGCIGSDQTGQGYWESWGANVWPRSLYLQQLKDRLGSSAVDDVVILEQKSGEIYDLLAVWGGQGNFSDGGFQGSIPNVSFVNQSGTIDVATWDGSDIQVEASDADGTIESVKLLINGEPIASDDQAPYTFTDLTAKIQGLPHIVHYLQAIATDNNGNTSSTRAAIIGGDSPLGNFVTLEHPEMRVFPNPTQNRELTIQMKETGSYTGKVLDLQGRTVDQFIFQGVEYKGMHEHLPEGIYILEIQDEDKMLFRMKLTIK